MKKDKDFEKFNWFLKKYIYPQRVKIAFIVLLILVGSFIGNLSPFLYGKMLDSIVAFDINHLMRLIIIYFIVTVGTTILSIFEGYMGKMVSFKIVKSSQRDLFNKIVRLKASAFEKYTSGELISRLNGDSEGVVSFLLDVITSILNIFINISVSLYFVLKISIKLSSVSIFYIPASLIVTIAARKRFKKLAEKRKIFNDKYFGYVNETFSNNIGIKCFRLEKKACDKYDNFILKELDIEKHSMVLGGIIQMLNTLISVISSLYIIYLSGILIKDGLLTIGTMVSFNTYINKLFASISQILGLNISKQTVSVSLDRLISLISEKSEDMEEYEKELKNEPDYINVRNVCFRYNDDSDTVINNLSFSLDSPGFYSFVGKNGCGKSTLAKLLVKLYDVDSGYMEINGIDYNNCSIDSLRENITYIQKEDFFLNDTIYNNLSLANERVSAEDIYISCQAVGIDEFINSLPDKYDTVVGEGGSTLSSGQRQKLNIARALLKKTKILIFDETTSNLDGESEKNVIAILKKISKYSIVIFISHKVLSIVQSDRIFLMENGNIVDSGTHEQLSKNNDMYRELFKYSDP
ncbi:ABC transporter ATP-binding protein [Sporanaerobacter acetigenes]|uniref:ABC transporter ATP-binding protein n=1 Tax=Sporanaerobacter acetigenes TaxID=165813 RepID=UPI001053964E|nr:ABC transporter ATP-binding protein [Sporanaerobacter acetigenes]